jgi:guanylate kinase
VTNGIPVLLEIELEGARQVRNSLPEAIQIFLAPPRLKSLKNGFADAEPKQRRRSSVDSSEHKKN